MTSDGVFSIKGGDGGAMTPAAIVPERQTGRGASRLDPILVDSVLFYQPINTSVVRALGFTFETDGYRSNNVSIFSPHFFKGKRIVSWAYQEEPYSCVWTVLNDGTLLCFTWEEEQQVWGWTDCSVNGAVEQVATIREEGYDRLYASIRRTIAGVERRFHERLALPHVDDIATACHLDCAVTQVYETASTEVGQLWHLEGETVSATADGYAFEGLVVAGGKVTLPYEANIVTVGLPYEGIIETLPFVLGGEKHVARQQIGAVVVRALETRGVEISTDGITFDPLAERDGPEPWLLPVAEARDFYQPTGGNWNEGATLILRQQQPLPAHVVALFVDVLVAEDEFGM